MTTTDLTACYWCADPIDHRPGTAVVGLHWNRRPREIIEPAADDLEPLEACRPRIQRRFAWGFVTEYGHAHARCAEDAAGARPGQLSDRYEYPWGEPDPDEAARRDLVVAIVNGVGFDPDDDDQSIDEVEAAAALVDEQYEPDLDDEAEDE